MSRRLTKAELAASMQATGLSPDEIMGAFSAALGDCEGKTVEDMERSLRLQDAAGDLLAACEAAESILWMAREYAESGGSGGPEMRDFADAEAVIAAALRKARQEVPS